MSLRRSCWIGFILTSILLSACSLPVRYTEVRGSGNLTTVMRPMPAINAVELDGVGRLIIQAGERTLLEITADDNLINYINTVPKGTTLRIFSDDFVNLVPRQEIIYRLTVKDLRRVSASGMGEIEIKSLQTDRLDIKLSGNNHVLIQDLSAGRVTLDISGLGKVEISGDVGSQDVRISGMGTYNGAPLLSRKAQVYISGEGSAIIWVTDELKADLSGAGNIRFYGSPKVNTNISGSGSVESLGEK